jgi:SAM-dependent methyltransferase
MAHPLELTGERTLPDVPEENYWYRRHVAVYRLAARLAEGRVLEVGCGEGYGSAMLAKRATVTALEYEPAVALHAARRYPDLRVAVADACRLPVRDAAFDAVIALQVVEHLYCAEAFVSACRRALRPDGVLLLSTPNRTTFSPDGPRNPFHAHEFTAGELEGLARTVFGDVRILGLHHRGLLRAHEALADRSLPAALVERGYQGLSPAGRALVWAVREGNFRLARRGVERSLDLVAVCRP